MPTPFHDIHIRNRSLLWPRTMRFGSGPWTSSGRFVKPISEIEAVYIEECPPGLFPDNQDSNFGLHRRIFTDVLQDIADQIELIYNERFPDTANDFLPFYEDELGLPIDPDGISLDSRRSMVAARMKKGAFTRGLLKATINPFIVATFGTPPAFGPEGIVIGAGIPLFGVPPADPTIYYHIIEDPTNFHYTIEIDHRLTPYMAGLTRELTRITPAHYHFDFTTF